MSLIWYDWCDATLQIARESNKPIYLYIYYSGCEWCSKMDTDTLSDYRVIEYLSTHYVCIRVDKDNRCDIDKYYQQVYQIMTRQVGGWPLSIFLTPCGKPFYSGTYYPLHTDSVVGFLELIEILHHKYTSNPQGILHNAKELLKFVGMHNRPKQPIKLPQNIIDIYIIEVSKSYDTINGGFGKAPKFANHAILLTLLHISHPHTLDMAIYTMSSMARGGMYDIANGGFYRYSIDDEYKVPHIEKTIYDNALLIECYIKAYFVTKDDFYRHTALDTLSFLCEYMSDGVLYYTTEGLAISAQNAMCIKSLLIASKIDTKYAHQAKHSLDTLLHNVYRDGILYHTTTLDTVAFLDDYAYLVSTLIEASSIDDRYISLAHILITDALKRYYDNGKWYMSDVLRVQADSTDSTIPSSIGIIVQSMLHFSEYHKFASHTITYYSQNILSHPIAHSTMIKNLL